VKSANNDARISYCIEAPKSKHAHKRNESENTTKMFGLWLELSKSKERNCSASIITLVTKRPCTSIITHNEGE
jgi:hypothetical protein